MKSSTKIKIIMFIMVLVSIFVIVQITRAYFFFADNSKCSAIYKVFKN